MANFSAIIQEINEQITTNGQRAITGAKLNEVLRDMISSVDEEKMDVVEIDTVPTDGSTNPVQSGGVYDALQDKPTIYYTQDIEAIPPTILAILNVGDFVKYGEWYEAIAIVAAIADGRTFLCSFNGIAVDGWVYSNGDVEHYMFNLLDFVARPSDSVVGHLAELTTFGDLTDSGIAASDVATTSDLAGKQDTISDLDAIRSGAALGATALQTETDPTVPSWAKQSTKPSYDYSEIGNTPDLSGFITNTVNNLTNYYLKSETYTQAEVNALIGAIQQFHYEIYPTLPQTGQSNVLYLIGPTGSGADKYEEYVYSNSAFTKIGDTSIDLSGYVTTSALNTALSAYTTTSDLTTLLAGKLNAPTTAGTSGQVLTSDGQGGQSWQTPTSAVSDVTVDGTSIVSSGTAAIVTLTTTELNTLWNSL